MGKLVNGNKQRQTPYSYNPPWVLNNHTYLYVFYRYKHIRILCITLFLPNFDPVI